MQVTDPRIMRAADCVLFLAVMVLAFAVDGNEQVFGLSEKASAGLVFFVFSCAIVVGLWLVLWDRAFRLPATVTLLVYAAMLLTMVS